MDGAAQAGEREAHRVMKRLARRGLSLKGPLTPFKEIEDPAPDTVTVPTGEWSSNILLLHSHPFFNLQRTLC